ncbi:MAG: hypothetical protein HYV18_03370 [Gammaproteobacteria bacterium]|nr:hypothetical protein [Gammaproteobacteria bacterium]
MRRTHLRPLLLLLALTLGQWLSFAHAAQHPALAVDQPCPVCLHAQGLDGALPPAKPVLPAISGAARPVPPPPRRAAVAPLRRCTIRGPPLPLV